MLFPEELERSLKELGVQVMSLAVDERKGRVIVAATNIPEAPLPRKHRAYRLTYLYFTPYPHSPVAWNVEEF